MPGTPGPGVAPPAGVPISAISQQQLDRAREMVYLRMRARIAMRGARRRINISTRAFCGHER